MSAEALERRTDPFLQGLQSFAGSRAASSQLLFARTGSRMTQIRF